MIVANLIPWTSSELENVRQAAGVQKIREDGAFRSKGAVESESKVRCLSFATVSTLYCTYDDTMLQTETTLFVGCLSHFNARSYLNIV